MFDKWEKFKKRQEITKFADNFKTVIVIILILSVFVFTLLGKETVRPYIWYWATFMAALLVVSIIMDIVNANKIKKLGL